MPRGWLVLVIGLLLAPTLGPALAQPDGSGAPTGAADGPGFPWHQIGEGPVDPGLLATADGKLAWGIQGNGTLALSVAHVAVNQTVPIANLSGTGDQVAAFAYDGRWIVWSDDRHGNLDLFALDTEQDRAPVRVTETPGDDLQPTVDDGRAVWMHEGDLWSRVLPDGDIELLRAGVGSLPEPSIHDGLVAWSQEGRSAPFIAVMTLEPRALATLPASQGAASFGPRVHGDTVVWTSLVLGPGSGPSPTVEGAVVELATLTRTGGGNLTIDHRNLTAEPGPVKDATVAGDWVAWLELGESGVSLLRVTDHAGATELTVPGPISRGLLTDDHVVVIASASGPGEVFARPILLEPEPGPPVGWWTLVALGAVLVAAGFLMSQREDP